MKLSEKGKTKLNRFGYEFHSSKQHDDAERIDHLIHSAEFEQSDFEDVVTLTIGQAKLIKEMVSTYLNEHFPDYSQSDSDASDALDSAIWQAEGKQ